MKRGRQSFEEGNGAPAATGRRGSGASSTAGSTNAASSSGPPSSPAGHPYKKLKVEDALAYLDQVKQKFENQPQVYNRFLDIMKDFKSQQIDTPGVIARVSELFKGHTSLLLGFNTFLPPGYKIDVPFSELQATVGGASTSQPATSQPADVKVQSNARGASTSSTAAVSPGGSSASTLATTTASPALAQATPTTAAPQTTSAAPSKKQSSAQLGAGSSRGTQKGTIDFDQAISYVTKIKLRFSSQPDTYKAFLEILHTYQKEQTTIKKVYDQVATLFKDHPDLLEEFTQFLPIPVKDGGAGAGTSVGASSSKAGSSVGSKGRAAAAASREQQKKSQQKAKVQHPTSSRKQRTSQQAGTAAASSTHAASSHAVSYSGSKKKDTDNIDFIGDNFESPDKLPAFFERVKARIRNRDTYKEFLKCLNLYAQEVISQKDMLSLVEDLIGKFPDLMDQLRSFVGASEKATADHGRAEKGAGQIDDVPDYENLRRDAKYGPSYRALPRNLQQPKCSGRTELCDSVLNNLLVSVPAGSEEGRETYRKTQFDEILFQCEDDRCELDIVIEQNMSTLLYLGPIAEKIPTMTYEEVQKFKLESLRDIHLAAIARIYGDRGAEIVDHLRRNPAIAVPVIVKRLKQKDEEWRSSRRELNKFWREIYEMNHEKAQEANAALFKSIDKKQNLATKSLITQMAEHHQFHGSLEYTMRAPAIETPNSVTSTVEMHQDVEHLMFDICAKSLPNHEDVEKIARFWRNVIRPFFCLPTKKDDALPGANVTSNLPHEALVIKPADGQANGRPPVSLPLAETSSSDTASASEQSRVQILYGNSTIFAFIRLYQILFERLCLALKYADNTYREKRNAATLITEKAMTSITTAPSDKASSSDAGTSSSAVENPDNKDLGIDDSSPKNNYNKLLDATVRFVEGTLDANHYEEEVVRLIGYWGFVQFTIDKLFSYFLKQLQLILSDHNHSRALLNAYDYERRRLNAFAKGRDQSYALHAARILQGETCYRFEFNPTTLKLDIRIQDPPEIDSERTAAEEKGYKYVETFMNTGVTENTTHIRNKPFVFQNRLLRRMRNSDVFANTHFVNGLECKISIATYKMFYVEDTEDFYFRHHKSTGRAIRKRNTLSTKAARFTTWLQRRQTDLQIPSGLAMGLGDVHPANSAQEGPVSMDVEMPAAELAYTTQPSIEMR